MTPRTPICGSNARSPPNPPPFLTLPRIQMPCAPPRTPCSPRRPHSLGDPGSGAETSRPGGPAGHWGSGRSGPASPRPGRKEGGPRRPLPAPALGPRAGRPVRLASGPRCRLALQLASPCPAAGGGGARGRGETAALDLGPGRAPSRVCLVSAGAAGKGDPLRTGRASGRATRGEKESESGREKVPGRSGGARSRPRRQVGRARPDSTPWRSALLPAAWRRSFTVCSSALDKRDLAVGSR